MDVGNVQAVSITIIIRKENEDEKSYKCIFLSFPPYTQTFRNEALELW